MRTIHLHGHLKDKFGDQHRLNVATAAEGIRALSVNFKDFTKTLEEGSYHVVRGDPKTGMSLALEDVSALKLGHADLHIIPVVAGSKNNGGMMKAILGVALIGAAIFMGPIVGAAGFATPIAGTGITWGNVALFGAIMALAGVSQMLTNTDKKTEEGKDESFTLSGPTNFYEQGSPVPLVFGEVITGGVTISGGIDIEDIGEYQA